MSQMTGRPLNKGWFARIEGGEVVSYFIFQFNPTETERERNVTYTFESAPGSSAPTAIFQSILGDKITIELFLDATAPYYEEQKGITAALAELESYTQPKIELFSADIGQVPSPPTIRYGMNEDYWDVVVPRIRIRTLRWNRDLNPTRARVEIEMQAVFTDISAIQSRLDKLKQYREMITRSEI